MSKKENKMISIDVINGHSHNFQSRKNEFYSYCVNRLLHNDSYINLIGK